MKEKKMKTKGEENGRCGDGGEGRARVEDEEVE